jgi:hypothetical protein
MEVARLKPGDEGGPIWPESRRRWPGDGGHSATEVARLKPDDGGGPISPDLAWISPEVAGSGPDLARGGPDLGRRRWPSDSLPLHWTAASLGRRRGRRWRRWGAVRHHCLADGREFDPEEAQISSLNLDAVADLGQICPALGDF